MCIFHEINWYIDALVRDGSISSALAMEILQSCTKASIYSSITYSLASTNTTSHCPPEEVYSCVGVIKGVGCNISILLTDCLYYVSLMCHSLQNLGNYSRQRTANYAIQTRLLLNSCSFCMLVIVPKYNLGKNILINDVIIKCHQKGFWTRLIQFFFESVGLN